VLLLVLQETVQLGNIPSHSKLNCRVARLSKGKWTINLKLHDLTKKEKQKNTKAQIHQRYNTITPLFIRINFQRQDCRKSLKTGPGLMFGK